LLVGKNNQCNFPARKVLLVSDVFVGAQKHFVPGLLGLLNQLAVFQLVPTDPPRKGDFVVRKTTRSRLRGAVVE
jgi:hypothetical protein